MKAKGKSCCLEQQQLEMDEILRENQRLKRLLDFKQEGELCLNRVRVIGKNPETGLMPDYRQGQPRVTVNMAP